MTNEIDKSPQDWCDAINAEIAEIKRLHPDPIEALYRWVDKTIGIPPNSLAGGLLAGVDALPVYIDEKTGKYYCCAIPLILHMFSNTKVEDLPILCGMAKYDTASGQFAGAILLKSWPDDWHDKLKKGIEEAFKDIKRGAL